MGQVSISGQHSHKTALRRDAQFERQPVTRTQFNLLAADPVLGQRLLRIAIQAEEVGMFKGDAMAQFDQLHHHGRRTTVQVRVDVLAGGQHHIQLGQPGKWRDGTAARQQPAQEQQRNKGGSIHDYHPGKSMCRLESRRNCSS